MPHSIGAAEGPDIPTKYEWPPENAFRTAACPACFPAIGVDCPVCDGMGSVLVCDTAPA